jgi:anti-anti-sigma factor
VGSGSRLAQKERGKASAISLRIFHGGTYKVHVEFNNNDLNLAHISTDEFQKDLKPDLTGTLRSLGHESVNRMVDSSSQSPSMKVAVRRSWDGVVIDAAGDLDLSSVPAFTEHYDSARLHLSKMFERQILTLDFRNIRFIDSVGLALLLRIGKEASASKYSFRIVVREESQPDRVIKLGRFGEILHVTYDLGDAA